MTKQSPPDPLPCCPPPAPAQELDDERLAALCRALGHPHRVAILRFLLDQQSCFAGEIAEQLPVAPSTVSQHLAQLREAGLIRGEVDGPRRSYCVEPAALQALEAMVRALSPPREG